MSDWKEMWLDSWDRIYQEALDRGVPERTARRLADDEATGDAYERLADRADYLRKRAKEEA